MLRSKPAGSLSSCSPAVLQQDTGLLNTTDHLAYVTGYPDGTFCPDRNITRAEAMAMINRMLGRRPESTSDLAGGMNS